MALALAFAAVVGVASGGCVAAVATSVGVGIDSVGAAKNACGGDDACDAAAATAADRETSGAA